MIEQHELEAKFELDHDAVPALLALQRIADLARTGVDSKRQIDIYFDTQDMQLRHLSSSLRVRDIRDGEFIATFKGPRQSVGSGESDHLMKRLEVEAPVDSSIVMHFESNDFSIEQLDSAPFRRAQQIVGSQAVIPIARLTTHRQVLVFSRQDGIEAELVVDNSVGERLSDNRVSEFAEIELEVRGGDDEALETIAARLVDQLPLLRPSSISKLARTLD